MYYMKSIAFNKIHFLDDLSAFLQNGEANAVDECKKMAHYILETYKPFFNANKSATMNLFSSLTRIKECGFKFDCMDNVCTIFVKGYQKKDVRRCSPLSKPEESPVEKPEETKRRVLLPLIKQFLIQRHESPTEEIFLGREKEVDFGIDLTFLNLFSHDDIRKNPKLLFLKTRLTFSEDVGSFARKDKIQSLGNGLVLLPRNKKPN